jgi:hypothetical protein
VSADLVPPSALTRLHQDLRAIVAWASRNAAVESSTESQLRRSHRTRRRLRRPASTRHIADVIAATRGPAGLVSHVRIAAALAGDPVSLSDPVLMQAIVTACYSICGRTFVAVDTEAWPRGVAKAAAAVAREVGDTSGGMSVR